MSNLLDRKKQVAGHYNTLVIAGGSTRGIAALGALHYLSTNGLLLYIQNYIGTSSGALLSYLLCIGYTPLDLITHLIQTPFLKNIQFYNIMNLLENRGVLNWTWIHEHLESLTIKKLGRLMNMKDIPVHLNRNFVCVTYNESTNQTEYLTALTHPDLPCLTALRMSCSVPILFDRFQYNRFNYIDGGFGDNFPILHFDRDENNLTLGINFSDHSPIDHPSLMGYIYRLFMIPIATQTERNIAQISNRCTVINLDTSQIHSFDFDLSLNQKLDMFSQGFGAIKKHFDSDQLE